MEKITDKAQLTEAYHCVQNALECFGRLSPNINKNLCEIVQHIYGRLDNCAYKLMIAGNTFDNEVKIENLRNAKEEVLFLFGSIEALVKTRGLTVGAANEVILTLRKAHESIGKWLSAMLKIKH